MSNLVGEMLVGRVGFGESYQACPTSYSAEDAMARSIVRLECEADELRAEVAMLREQARILARERDEAIQERERWKMQAEQKWGMRRELEELLGVKDTQCDEQFAKGLAALRDLIQERDEARVQYRTTEALAMALVKTIDELKTEKAELFVQLVNLQAGSRRATLDEISESVRDKYDLEYEREEIEN